MSRVTDMTTGSVCGRILRFAFPLILANIGQQLYMIADAAIVGQGLGVSALAAVGATDWCYWLILWTVIGFTQAFATFIARRFGRGDHEAMRATLGTSVLLCLLIGGAMTLLGMLLSRPLLLLLDTPADILPQSLTYFRTMVAGTLVVTAYNMAASVLRALGDGRTPLLAMVIAALLNVGLDCLFVLVLPLGIFGAALASVIAQLVSFLFCLFCIVRIPCARIRRSHLRFGGAGEMLLFALPIAFQYLILSLGGIILQSTVNLGGSAFVAGYTATNKLYGLLEATAIALGMAFSTFCSQNYGARNYARVRTCVRQGFLLSVGASTVITVLIFFFSRPLLTLFLDTSEEAGAAALAVGERYLFFVIACLFVLYLLHMYRNVLQAIGNSSWSMYSGIAEFAVRVVMAKVVVGYMGRDALFLAEPLAWALALLSVMLPYYLYFKRRRLPIR